MKAARLLNIRDLQLVDTDIPTPGPGEIIIKVAAAGICGTDRHLYHGEFPGRTPVTLGHEFAGPITAKAPDVTLALGALITCDPNIPCGTCDPCRIGRPNLCPNNQAIGIHLDGGFADYARLPAHRAHLMPASLNPEHAAFAEPLACTLHGIDLGAPMPGQRVIVIGGGVIGLLALQLARNAGAEVMLITRQKAKRNLAMDLGAETTAATPRDALTQWPQGADLVMECAGVPETVEASSYLARRGGKVVILGVLPKGQKVQIEPLDLLLREISIIPSFINPFTQSRAAAMIAAGALSFTPLITRRIALSDAPAVIAAPAQPGEVKVMVLPG